MEDLHGHLETEGSLGESDTGLNIVSVGVPSGRRTQLIVRNDMTVNDMLKVISEVCAYSAVHCTIEYVSIMALLSQKHHLNCADHYVRLKLSTSDGVYGIIPDKEEFLVDLVRSPCKHLNLYLNHVHLCRCTQV